MQPNLQQAMLVLQITLMQCHKLFIGEAVIVSRTGSNTLSKYNLYSDELFDIPVLKHLKLIRLYKGINSNRPKYKSLKQELPCRIKANIWDLMLAKPSKLSESNCMRQCLNGSMFK